MIRLIGLGSPFGDDRLGWDLVQSMRGRVPMEIDLVALDRPGAALVNWMAGVDWLVLVDAYQAAAEIGRYRRIDPSALVSQGHPWNSHALDLVQTLSLARQLGLKPARLDLYGIAIGDPAQGRDDAASAAAARLATRLATNFCRSTAGETLEAGDPRAATMMSEPGKNSLP